MIRRMQGQLGTVGLVVGVVALIAALAGTAIAAKSVFTKKQEKQIVKIAKRYAGKNGAPGAPGSPGAQGQAGPKGDTGARGPEGPEGPEGREGPEGAPWVAGGTLPSGDSLSGNWAAGLSNPIALGSISFGIPLESSPAVAIVPFEETNEKCPGTLTAPAADAGTLCIYLNEGTSVTEGNVQANQAGAIISIFGSPAIGSGTWAVTAP